MAKDKKGEKKARKVSPNHPSQSDCLKGLNSQQSRFVRLYIATHNARGAAREAGYKGAGAGGGLLKQERVAYWVKKLKGEIAQKLEINAEKVIYELGRVAFANLTDVVEFGRNGITIKDSKTLPDDIKAAIQEVSETITGKSSTLKIKMHDKLGALDKLGRHFGIYEKDKKDNDGDPLEALRSAILGSSDEDKAQLEEEEKAKKLAEEEEDDTDYGDDEEDEEDEEEESDNDEDDEEEDEDA